ncbi:hypothetical protein C8J57DRAFT_1233788 [Mycena rebaudengoi]|nr:hypothetical protein C8J57DRAFT_1233788 [Mycena rebaudengoi]
MALSGAWMHDADPEGLAGMDHRPAYSTHPLVRAVVDGHTTGAAHDLQDTSPMAYFDPRISASPQSTGDNASLALLATIGAFGTPPDMSRTAPILTADVLALSLTGVLGVKGRGCARHDLVLFFPPQHKWRFNSDWGDRRLE